jgi:stage II sporulation protein D
MQPTVRVGVSVEQRVIAVSSPAGLRLSDALTGQPAGEVRPERTIRLSAANGLLRVEGDLAMAPSGVPSMVLHPAIADAPVVVDGVPYRGAAEVRAVAGDAVTAINFLPLEDYLLGVVPLEIGPREPDEIAAVEAQSVAARTYAVSHLGGHADMGFDLYGSIQDQAYGGMAVERDQATRAVRGTEGDILMFDDRPIRAFYHSTCGGRTAAVEEVMDREPAPYLRSVSDRAPDGTDYCSASPRYRWSVVWTGNELDRIARRELAAHFGVAPDAFGRIEGIEVVSRTPSGRVANLAFRGPGVDLVVSRLDIRRALPGDARILNSTDFTVARRIDGLVELYGRGYGHGAGMCQWGAIGRAREGQSYEEILAAYYPGAVLVNAYGGEE